ncbi:MAG: ATP-binding protein [Anaerolineae bacterium]|nr:ATP-binding protein [Anaerolineae bacterium]
MSNQMELFPGYISRSPEEQSFSTLLQAVQNDGQSRAIVVYGPGGIGKTYLLRHLSEGMESSRAIFLTPIDVDDPEYWVRGSIQYRIAQELNDKWEDSFQPYFKFVASSSPDSPVLSEKFIECYQILLNEKGCTPVIFFDTVETVRDAALRQPMLEVVKGLHNALFVIACRPTTNGKEDPIVEELRNTHQPIPHEIIQLSGFDFDNTVLYIKQSRVAEALSLEEIEKLALLTGGHPLWLALSLEYLDREGLPPSLKISVTDLRHKLPFNTVIDADGERIREDFIRHLLTLYRETGFWSEIFRRLAVVRYWVSKSVWIELSSLDLSLPADVSSWDDAWEKLLSFPWIRIRANQKHITLHDALKEEIDRHILPWHDRQYDWRRKLWESAATVFLKLSNELDNKPVKSKVFSSNDRDREQLTLALIWYLRLCNYEETCKRFVVYFDSDAHRLQAHLASLIDSFLPSRPPSVPRYDSISPSVEGFRQWLVSHPEVRYEVERRIARYYTNSGKSGDADELISILLDEFVNVPDREYWLLLQRGNARMRLSGKVQFAHQDFERALQLVQASEVGSTLSKLEGKTYKELGFYFRNVGDWDRTVRYYLNALRAARQASEQKEVASIMANLAFVQALQGQPAALDYAEAALQMRENLGSKKEIGQSYSILGEVFRYQRRYSDAWNNYAKAENIFEELGDWPWLAKIRQQQAICLFQAAQNDQMIDSYGQAHETLERARGLIIQALDLCKEQSVRDYPSALNRAGRIFGYGFEDYERGLAYFSEGADKAKDVFDNQFWLANLIEYAELCYYIWVRTKNSEYLDRLIERSSEIENLVNNLNFPDLVGRWHVMQGHLAMNNSIHSANENQQRSWLLHALEHYKRGFPQILAGSIGSSAIPEGLQSFANALLNLPETVGDEVYRELSLAWSDQQFGYVNDVSRSTTLHQHLDNFYEQLTMQRSTRNNL